MKIAHLIELYATRAAGLPDRTSPEEWPEALLITGDELLGLLREFADDLLALKAKDMAPHVTTREGMAAMVEGISDERLAHAGIV